jgi:hypothetical protein
MHLRRNTLCPIQLARQQGGQLLYAVLNDTLTADSALLQWPRVADPSLQVSYEALLHFSVDLTGYHQTEPLYADVQLSWLQQLCDGLLSGQPLPPDSRAGYARHAVFYYRLPSWWLWLDPAYWPWRQTKPPQHANPATLINPAIKSGYATGADAARNSGATPQG